MLQTPGITSTVTSRCASGKRSASDVFDPCKVGTAALPARTAPLSLIGHTGLRDVRSQPPLSGLRRYSPRPTSSGTLHPQM